MNPFNASAVQRTVLSFKMPVQRHGAMLAQCPCSSPGFAHGSVDLADLLLRDQRIRCEAAAVQVFTVHIHC